MGLLTNSNRGNLDNDEDGHPIPCGSECHATGPDPSSVDLTRVEPGHWKPTDAEEELEYKNKGHGCIGGAQGITGQQDCSENEADGQSSRGHHK